MITFRRYSLRERVLRLLSPSYRRRRDAELHTAIRELLDNPEQPCEIDGILIPDGYGTSLGLPKL